MEIDRVPAASLRGHEFDVADIEQEAKRIAAEMARNPYRPPDKPYAYEVRRQLHKVLPGEWLGAPVFLFDTTHAGKLIDLRAVGDTLVISINNHPPAKLPFSHCLFEFGNLHGFAPQWSDWRVLVVAAKRHGELIRTAGMVRGLNPKWLSLDVIVDIDPTKTATVTDLTAATLNHRQEVNRRWVMAMALAAIELLSQQDTKLEDRRLPRSQRTLAERRETSTSFSYHVVSVHPRPEPSPPQGGTHASPREHARRGHWRTRRKSGKRYWVRECMVMKGTGGAVLHDYVVEP